MEMNILDLPDCVLEQVIGYLCYDEIARSRLICKAFDKCGQTLLNRGFSKMVRRHSVNLKRIKSLLPRRESERRNHPMARHADILTCIETRLSMLSMTYTKYMELSLCCFIPGKVIDEVNRILKLIETTNKPLRAHEVLQELRDISSMAIEHFDEKIAHLLKKCFMELTAQKYTSVSTPPNSKLNCEGSANSSPFLFSETRPTTNPMQRTCGTTYRCVENTNKIQKLAQKYFLAITKFNRMIDIQNKQTRQLRENAVAMSEMNAQIVELKRRLELIKSSRTVDNGDLTSSENLDESRSACTLNINNSLTTNTGSSKSDVITSVKSRAAAMILKRRINEKVNKAELAESTEPPIKVAKSSD